MGPTRSISFIADEVVPKMINYLIDTHVISTKQIILDAPVFL